MSTTATCTSSLKSKTCKSPESFQSLQIACPTPAHQAITRYAQELNMVKHRWWVMLAILICSDATCFAAPATRPVLPLLDSKTFILARLDLNAIDPAAVMDWVTGCVQAAKLKPEDEQQLLQS